MRSEDCGRLKFLRLYGMAATSVGTCSWGSSFLVRYIMRPQYHRKPSHRRTHCRAMVLCAVELNCILEARWVEVFEVERWYARTILRVIWSVYVSLHNGTDSQHSHTTDIIFVLDAIAGSRPLGRIILSHLHHPGPPSLILYLPGDSRSYSSAKGDGVTLWSNPEQISSPLVPFSLSHSEEKILFAPWARGLLSSFVYTHCPW